MPSALLHPYTHSLQIETEHAYKGVHFPVFVYKTDSLEAVYHYDSTGSWFLPPHSHVVNEKTKKKIF